MHTVVLGDVNYWNALKAQVNTGYGYIASQNDPAAYGVAAAQWVRNLGVSDSSGNVLPQFNPYNPNITPLPGVGNAGNQYDQAAWNLGSTIISLLGGGMRAVMVDELKSTTTELIARTCAYVSSQGNYAGRWGVYVVNGPAVNFEALNGGPAGSTPAGNWPFDALNRLLDVDAQIAVELYAYYKPVAGNSTSSNFNYCSKGKDPWLQAFLVGGANSYGIAANRLGWLWNLRASRGSSSVIRPIFGVTDTPASVAYLAGPSPGAFLDRFFYVFSHTSYGGLLRYTNDGGAGSWKWEAANVSTSGRDELFSDSFNHYCKPPYLTSSRLGAVPC